MDDRTVYQRIDAVEGDFLDMEERLTNLELEVKTLREELGNYGGAPEGE